MAGKRSRMQRRRGCRSETEQVVSMELPRRKSDHGMLDGLKSKLGFSGGAAGDASDGYYDDDYADDYGDGYDEFAEYGPDYDATRTGTRYDAPDAVTTRAPRTSSARPARSSDGGFPRLVSIDDVRAHTRVPESLNRDPLPPRRSSSAAAPLRRGDRTVVNASQPAPSSPAYVAAASAAREAEREAEKTRSEGLESLFAPTTGAAGGSGAAGAAGAVGARPAGSAAAAGASARVGFDPYEAYAGSGAAAHDPARSLSVLMPAAYADVERVAKILKAGDAVVLSLRETPDALSKRVLDFSFGVASALDARVECVADKVFALTRDAALTDAERLALRGKGVL